MVSWRQDDRRSFLRIQSMFTRIVFGSIIIKDLAILRCNASTSYHREHVLFILRFHTNDILLQHLTQWFRGGLAFGFYK